jgi:CDP-diacylglycerol--serine O-phosphatidyltransferase
MRLLLAALLALHAPISAVAAVIERMPALELRSPETVTAPFGLSPMTGPTALPTTMLGAASPASAAAPTAVPAAAAAAPSSPAAPPAARGNLSALGASLARETNASAAVPGRSAALDLAFEGSHAAADGPEPARETESAPRPADLKPAAPAPKTPRWRAAVPNLLTFSNMASGVAAAFLASEGHFVAASLGILAANLFDALDGRAARALGVNNPLGIDLDSLADVVSFGAAPALLIFKAALLPALGWWGFPVAAAFAAAGLYRLARFNVGAHAEKSGAAPAKKSDAFTGLPIPGGAGVIVALTLALAALPAAAVAPVAVLTTLLAAAAMVSRLPYPAFKKGGMKALIAPAVVGAAAVAPLAALGLYAFIPAAVFGLYLASGPVAALRARKAN